MKQLLSILVLVLITSDSKGQDYRSPALWEENIVIDGQNAEWPHPFKLYNSSAGLSFSVANDSNYLYLSFEAIEPLYIVKMLRAGWYLQLTSKERRRRFNISIVFDPMYIELDPKHDYVEKKEKKTPTFENWLDDYHLEANTYTTQGLKHYQKNPIALSDTLHNWIRIQLDYTPQKAVYEIAIPLKELMSMEQIEWNERMKLKVNIDALDEPKEKSQLIIGTGSFQSSNPQQRGQVLPPSNTRTEQVIQPKKLTEGVGKDCLYYKANFSHEFHLVLNKKTN